MPNSNEGTNNLYIFLYLMFYLNSTNKKSAVEGSLVSLSLIDKRNLLWLLFSIVNKVFGLRLSSFINVVVNGEICLNSEFTDISFLLFMAKTKKGFVSASSPHFKKKQKTLQLCFFSAWMKRHISVFKDNIISPSGQQLPEESLFCCEMWIF